MPTLQQRLNADGNIGFSTGNPVHWAPKGFIVRLDTSWDHSGESVAVRESDVVKSHSGSPASLGWVEVAEGTPVLTGQGIYELCHPDAGRGNGGLGYSSDSRYTAEEAEEIFSRSAHPAMHFQGPKGFAVVYDLGWTYVPCRKNEPLEYGNQSGWFPTEDEARSHALSLR